MHSPERFRSASPALRFREGPKEECDLAKPSIRLGWAARLGVQAVANLTLVGGNDRVHDDGVKLCVNGPPAAATISLPCRPQIFLLRVAAGIGEGQHHD